MSAFSLKLNGTDFTAAINKWGVGWTPIKVTGPNQDISQAGTTIMDLLRVKDLLTLQGNDVLQGTYDNLRAICANDYITAVFTHPATGKIVTKVMMPSLSEARQKPMHGGRVWLSGWTLTLEER